MDIIQDALKKFSENNLEDLTVFSEIPARCKLEACYIGVDEAGRGPVLGPMVYGIFGSVIDQDSFDRQKSNGYSAEEIEKNPPVLIDSISKLDDSKKLTEKLRDKILVELVKLDYVVFGLKFLSPAQISSKSFRRQKYSLNEISHNAAAELIQGFVDRGVKIEKVYVDTVGPMDKYQQKLKSIFPDLTFKVDQKADSKYKPVSAASICAKVTRDQAVREWNFGTGVKIASSNWGSGYPGDPATKKFLAANIDPIFGFPNIVRNSWSTATKLLEEKATKVKWENELVQEKEVKDVPTISKYLKRKLTDDGGSASTSSAPKISGFKAKAKSQFFSYRDLKQTVTL